MLSGSAPPGMKAVLEVTVRLSNGTTHAAAWTTPLALKPTLHRAVRWIQKDMREKKIAGRSSMVSIRVNVYFEPGEFKK